MKIATVTVEIRTGHSPKESKALPFRLTFWGFVFMTHRTKELPMFINFRWEVCVHATQNERIAHVHKFSLEVCVHDTRNE
jgi:hypothetical protein